jgi:hypothetical protein
MGIHGMKRYLGLKYQCPEEGFGHGSNLLIDGSGWLFYLLDEDLSLQRQLGGSYDEIDKIVREELRHLQDMGFNLTVCLDGEQNRMKDATTTKRRQRREEMWTNLFHATLGDSDKPIVQKDLPIASLALNQLKCTLKSMDVEIIISDYEADQDIALLCLRRNSLSGLKSYCYGADR